MLRRARIIKLNTTENNHFTIYIPTGRSCVDKIEDPTATKEATAIHIRGIKNNYKVGDVVYVDFLDGQEDEPVILGKLLMTGEDDEEDLIEVDAKIIKVEEKAQLPNNTTIGDYKQNEINHEVKELIDDKKYDNK